MNMPNLIVLVGLPASGKSYKSQELAKEYNATVFSSDDLRQEIFGDIDHQEDNDKLFKELHKRIKECLASSNSAIYDACNISYKRRMAFLQELNKIPCEKICVVMATPYEECLKRNAERERKVPEYVIERMYKNFYIPWYIEGWDNIYIEYSDNSKNSFGTPKEWIATAMNFNQDNPHHKLTLGEHCLKVSQLVLNDVVYKDTPNTMELKYAGMLHDEGKIFTKNYIDSRGNSSEHAHYYQHHCCGAYDSLFFEFPANHLYVAILILWHMRPYMAWDLSEKSKSKDKKLFGKRLFDDIILLNKADRSAK